MKKSIVKKYVALLALVLAGETIFFLPFVLARIFRPSLLLVFDITNVELGAYFSVYGVVAMFAYVIGGPLADRYEPRKLMASALWLTALGGFMMSFIKSGSLLPFIYGFWGLTTIMLFWAAMLKATREWGGDGFQGRAFGWLEGGRGLTAALIGSMALAIFAWYVPDESLIGDQERIFAFRKVILSVSIFTTLIGMLVWWFVPQSKNNYKSEGIQIGQIKDLAKKTELWLLAIIIVCAYVGYKITDDFSLYAKEVLGFNELDAAGVGTSALWVRAGVAILAGWLADKTRLISIIIYAFALSCLGAVVVALAWLELMAGMALLNLLMIMLGIYSVRALYFALVHESKIPMHLTGTAIGLISLIGFTPDVFMSPWMGYLLDNNPGRQGHHHVFIVLAGFSAIGFLMALMLQKRLPKS